MEEEKNSEMEISLRDLGAVFLHCWWIMLIAAVVVTVALYAFLSSTHRDEYTAEASIYVMRTPDGENTTTSDISIATYLVRDAPDLILSHRVLDDVILKQNRILEYEDYKRREYPYPVPLGDGCRPGGGGGPGQLCGRYRL